MINSVEIRDGIKRRAEYQYNGLGQRIGQSIYGGNEPQNPEQHISYTLDLTRQYHNLLMSEDKMANKGQTFYWDTNVVALEEENESLYYLQDDLGSPMQLMDEEGEIRESYGFDELGMDMSFINPVETKRNFDGNMATNTRLQPFGYTGYQMEAVGGMYFAQARRYDSSVGRFISEDKIKGIVYNPITINPYLYCMNQPLDYWDLTGMSREDARDYMDEYATDERDKRNPEYPSYGANCANYVSQCLVAGGVDTSYGEWFCFIPEELSDFENDYWKLNNVLAPIDKALGIRDLFYNDDDSNHKAFMSSTWCNAPSQYKYFSNPLNGYTDKKVIKVSNYDELQKALKRYNIQTGDLLYWDIQDDNHPEHATIISKVDKDGLYFAGNTSARFDKKVVAKMFNQYSGLYIVRLRDEVFFDGTEIEFILSRFVSQLYEGGYFNECVE